jgi:hypothetical protein
MCKISGQISSKKTTYFCIFSLENLVVSRLLLERERERERERPYLASLARNISILFLTGKYPKNKFFWEVAFFVPVFIHITFYRYILQKIPVSSPDRILLVVFKICFSSCVPSVRIVVPSSNRHTCTIFIFNVLYIAEGRITFAFKRQPTGRLASDFIFSILSHSPFNPLICQLNMIRNINNPPFHKQSACVLVCHSAPTCSDLNKPGHEA